MKYCKFYTALGKYKAIRTSIRCTAVGVQAGRKGRLLGQTYMPFAWVGVPNQALGGFP